MGTQKNSLHETALLRTQNIYLKLWVRKYLQFYADNFCLSNRDANHSNFCGIIPFFKTDFRITISDIKFRKITILQAKMVPDKIRDVTLTYTSVLRTFYVAVDNYT